jgi:hypothetical protein
MFRAVRAHLQEALHERRLCAIVDVGWSQDVGRQSSHILTSIHIYNSVSG